MDSIHPLKSYRKRKRLTQDQLSKRLGVARVTLARWETGARNIDDDLLPKVSALTGIPRPLLRPDLSKLLQGGRGSRVAARDQRSAA